MKYRNMNKQELVSAIAEKAELTKADSENAVNAMVEAIKEALAKGESTQLIGFGTFSVSERAARTGRNPQTGKEIQIAAKKVVKFKAGKAIDEAVN
ncbi:HU family DNA-binding protein [Marinifilum caeruleilacunae]